MPIVHVMQWLGMFSLDFGLCYHDDTWWNVSCLAFELHQKEISPLDATSNHYSTCIQGKKGLGW